MDTENIGDVAGRCRHRSNLSQLRQVTERNLETSQSVQSKAPGLAHGDCEKQSSKEEVAIMIDWNALATPPRTVPGAMARLSKEMFSPRNDQELRNCLRNLDCWDVAYFGCPTDPLDYRNRQADLFGGASA
jgi:hypothetical protein